MCGLKALKCDRMVTSKERGELLEVMLVLHSGIDVKHSAVVVKWGNPLEKLQRSVKPLWFVMPSSTATRLRKWRLSKKNQKPKIQNRSSTHGFDT